MRVPWLLPLAFGGLVACGSSSTSPSNPVDAASEAATCDPRPGGGFDGGRLDAGFVTESGGGTIDLDSGTAPPPGRYACTFCAPDASVGLRCCALKDECWDPAVDPGDYCDRPFCK